MVSMVPPVVLLESTMARTDTLAFPDRRFFATSMSLVFRSRGRAGPGDQRHLLPVGIWWANPSQRYCSMSHRGPDSVTARIWQRLATNSAAQVSGPRASPAIRNRVSASLDASQSSSQNRL